MSGNLENQGVAWKAPSQYNEAGMTKSMNAKKSGPGGEFPYNGEMAHWWLQRSLEGAHKRAYRSIADFIRASCSQDPRLVIDYACGAGNLLSLLSFRFPHSNLIGLDGSAFLLGMARRRFSRLPADRAQRISLSEVPLPNFELRNGRADLAVFCFPNMTPYSAEHDPQEAELSRHAGDRMIAESLEPEAARVLEWNRSISHNLRMLLTLGGICVRVEYASVQRHELSPSELMRVSFEEGSLDIDVGGRRPRQWFRLLASTYFRSRVLEDVYQQTGDERDKDGGFLITVLKAI
jgi:SAM-dependent methyltransferase